MREQLRNAMTVAVAVAGALAACTPQDRDTARSEVDSAAGAIATGAESAARAVGRAVDTLAGRIAGPEYTNAELIGFIDAYNDAEIEIGRLAQTKATNAEVKAFATKIVAEHRALKTEVNNAAKALSTIGTMPENDENLAKDHWYGMRDLTAKPKGAEFDKAFVEHEKKMHKKVLDEIDDALGRNRNPELKATLEKARAGIQAHLTAAEELETKLGSAG